MLGSFSVMLHASDGLLADSQLVSITVLDPGNNVIIALPVEEGWNLVSLPVRPSDLRAVAVFPEATSAAFSYAGSYLAKDTLRNGPGYWLKFPSGLSLQLGGAAVGAETVSVRSGWNILGSASSAVSIGSLAPVSPATVTSSIFGYSALAGYSAADSVRPGRGYWLKMSQDGQVVLSAPVVSNTTGPAAATDLVQEEVPAAVLTLTDGSGRKRELSLFTGSADRGNGSTVELPPVPPEGGFDVRFQPSQSMAARLGPETRTTPVSIAAQSGRLHIAWKIMTPGLLLELTADRAVASGAPLIMAGTGAGEILLRTGRAEALLSVMPGTATAPALPDRMTLAQNFPNPFNPSTVIAYILPADALVRLVVFDLLGREVRELARGEQTAGRHSVVWDAGNVSGGVYYYRLEAVDLSDPSKSARETKKMFLIR